MQSASPPARDTPPLASSSSSKPPSSAKSTAKTLKTPKVKLLKDPGAKDGGGSGEQKQPRANGAAANGDTQESHAIITDKSKPLSLYEALLQSRRVWSHSTFAKCPYEVPAELPGTMAEGAIFEDAGSGEMVIGPHIFPGVRFLRVTLPPEVKPEKEGKGGEVKVGEGSKVGVAVEGGVEAEGGSKVAGVEGVEGVANKAVVDGETEERNKAIVDPKVGEGAKDTGGVDGSKVTAVEVAQGAVGEKTVAKTVKAGHAAEGGAAAKKASKSGETVATSVGSGTNDGSAEGTTKNAGENGTSGTGATAMAVDPPVASTAASLSGVGVPSAVAGNEASGSMTKDDARGASAVVGVTGGSTVSSVTASSKADEKNKSVGQTEDKDPLTSKQSIPNASSRKPEAKTTDNDVIMAEANFADDDAPVLTPLLSSPELNPEVPPEVPPIADSTATMTPPPAILRTHSPAAGMPEFVDLVAISTTSPRKVGASAGKSVTVSSGTAAVGSSTTSASAPAVAATVGNKINTQPVYVTPTPTTTTPRPSTPSSSNDPTSTPPSVPIAPPPRVHSAYASSWTAAVPRSDTDASTTIPSHSQPPPLPSAARGGAATSLGYSIGYPSYLNYMAGMAGALGAFGLTRVGGKEGEGSGGASGGGRVTSGAGTVGTTTSATAPTTSAPVTTTLAVPTGRPLVGTGWTAEQQQVVNQYLANMGLAPATGGTLQFQAAALPAGYRAATPTYAPLSAAQGTARAATPGSTSRAGAYPIYQYQYHPYQYASAAAAGSGGAGQGATGAVGGPYPVTIPLAQGWRPYTGSVSVGVGAAGNKGRAGTPSSVGAAGGVGIVAGTSGSVGPRSSSVEGTPPAVPAFAPVRTDLTMGVGQVGKGKGGKRPLEGDGGAGGGGVTPPVAKKAKVETVVGPDGVPIKVKKPRAPKVKKDGEGEVGKGKGKGKVGKEGEKEKGVRKTKGKKCKFMVVFQFGDVPGIWWVFPPDAVVEIVEDGGGVDGEVKSENMKEEKAKEENKTCTILTAFYLPLFRGGKAPNQQGVVLTIRKATLSVRDALMESVYDESGVVKKFGSKMVKNKVKGLEDGDYRVPRRVVGSGEGGGVGAKRGGKEWAPVGVVGSGERRRKRKEAGKEGGEEGGEGVKRRKVGGEGDVGEKVVVGEGKGEGAGVAGEEEGMEIDLVGDGDGDGGGGEKVTSSVMEVDGGQDDGVAKGHHTGAVPVADVEMPLAASPSTVVPSAETLPIVSALPPSATPETPTPTSPLSTNPSSPLTTPPKRTRKPPTVLSPPLPATTTTKRKRSQHQLPPSFSAPTSPKRSIQTLTSSSASASTPTTTKPTTTRSPKSAKSAARRKSVSAPVSGAATPVGRSDDEGGGAGGKMKKCSYCRTVNTPMWRKGPGGPKTLCNACGVKFMLGKLVIGVGDVDLECCGE
ncbi:hypothetical protein HDV00_011205 [Rhizophlyctis rosea]|nr:hypothetical protein HDV00_011205 [Rhizophlyctis rosea]